MSTYIENNKMMTDSQHGFRKKRSSLTNFLDFTETVSKLIDGGDAVDVLYLDFQKAFDKVLHNSLLAVVQIISYWNQRRNFKLGRTLAGK